MLRKPDTAVAVESDLEADPEGYTPLREPLPVYDLSNIVTGHERTVHELRAMCLPYLHADFTIAPTTIQCSSETFGQGGRGVIALLQSPSVTATSRGNVSFKVTRQYPHSNQPHQEPMLSALVGPRLQPYLQLHAGLGNENLRQAEGMTRQRGELTLAVLSILGSGFEGLYNGVAPGKPHFHAQYVLRALPIFEIDSITRWPLRALRESFHTLVEAASWMERMQDEERRYGYETDFLFRREGEGNMAVFTAICLPRRQGTSQPVARFGVADRYDSLFRGLGALDVGGYCVAPRTAEAFQILAENPGLYERELRGLST